MCGEPFGVARPVQDAAHDPDLEQVGHVLAAFAFLVDKLAGVVDLLAVEFGRRPLLTPRARAALMPLRVRSMMRPRSNSASAPKI